MLFSTSLLLPALLPVTLAASRGLQTRQTSCAAVHIFQARGNGESYPGRVGEVDNYVCAGLDSCTAENIEYDSTLSYCDQVQDGIAAGISQLATYISDCPTSKIVLAGYSLGAQIVGGILAGEGGEYYGCEVASNVGLTPDSGSGAHIDVVLLFGNPRHDADQTYNVGNGSVDNGQFIRNGSNLAALNAFSADIQDYCLETDPICALGDDGESHTTYITVYGQQAGAWAQEKLGLGGSTTYTSSSSAAASSTSSSSSSSASGSSSVSSTSSASGSSTSGSSASGSSASGSSVSGSSATGSSGSSAAATSGSATSVGSLTDSSSSPSITSAPVSSAAATSSSSTSSYNTNTPFVFSNTATVATTSTFVPSTFSSIATTYTPTSVSKPLITGVATSTPGSGSGSGSGFGSSSTASASGSASNSSSASSTSVPLTTNGASFPHASSLTFGLVTLAVLKALVF